MPESSTPISPDPPPPPPLPDIVVGARPVRKQVSNQQFDDHLIAELLANEAAVMASIGILPEEAPAPSPGLHLSVTDVWASCQARLEAHVAAGMLPKGVAGNTRDLIFYPPSLHTSRRGLWLAEGCAHAHHYAEVDTATLSANTQALGYLEQVLGVSDVRNQLLLAGQEHLLRQHGLL